MKLSEQIIEQETYMDGSREIRRYRHIGDRLLSDAVADLEAQLAECQRELAAYKAAECNDPEAWPLIVQLKRERDALREAIVWALGYTDFPPRRDGEGGYWWRTELRERSGLTHELCEQITAATKEKENDGE